MSTVRERIGAQADAQQPNPQRETAIAVLLARIKFEQVRDAQQQPAPSGEAEQR